ncbi:MAG: tetratricopeptide repeat protein [Thermodesulfobacteriota bacterium]|nr:tetratricopeptide repeat protein [Thermodesulfobacteriota bacterium]
MGLFSYLFSKPTKPDTPQSSAASGHGAAQQNQHVSAEDGGETSNFDLQLQDILANYPKELAERYPQKSPEFLRALVLASQGEDRRALDLLAKLPIGEQDDLFDYELGILMARHGHDAKACNTMRSCLRQNPDHLLAAETLVILLVGLEKNDEALELSLKMLLEERDSAFCHAQLATLYHLQQDNELALKHGLHAIDAGHNDPNIILFVATLLEQNNELEQAETLYAKIPGGRKCSVDAKDSSV